MTAIEAYILAKNVAMGAVSGIANIRFSGTQLVFEFTDGTSSSMDVPLPEDGLSISNVKIDDNNHLICTLSDNSTIDAGEIPGGKAAGGGVLPVDSFDSLPYPGEPDILYLVLDTESLYYYDTTSKEYHPIGTNGEMATKEDIDKLFDDDTLEEDFGLATRDDIDSLFKEV